MAFLFLAIAITVTASWSFEFLTAKSPLIITIVLNLTFTGYESSETSHWHFLWRY